MLQDEQPLLETIKQLAGRSGLSQNQIRGLIESGRLEHIWIGKRIMIPSGAFERLITNDTVKPCLDETKDHASDSSPNATFTTSCGLKTGAAASAALARQTANKLKRSSLNGSVSAQGETGSVIPLRYS